MYAEMSAFNIVVEALMNGWISDWYMATSFALKKELF